LAGDSCRGAEEAEDRERRGTFARSGFANDAEHFGIFKLKARAPNGFVRTETNA
jgi:hypothetical protein